MIFILQCYSEMYSPKEDWIYIYKAKTHWFNSVFIQILVKHFPRCDFIQLFHTNLSSMYYYCVIHIFENLTSTIFCQRMLCPQETHTHTHTHTHINALNWWSNSSLLLIKLNWLIIKRTFETKKLIEKPFFSSF